MTTSEQVNNPNNYIPMPDTPVLDSRGYFAREWVYYFTQLGKIGDTTITADLSNIVGTQQATLDQTALQETALALLQSPEPVFLDAVAMPAQMLQWQSTNW